MRTVNVKGAIQKAMRDVRVDLLALGKQGRIAGEGSRRKMTYRVTD